MSATNWAACPRCLARMRAAKSAKLTEAADSYGKVSIEEFDRLRVEAEAMPTEQRENAGLDEGGYSLREDYNGSCQIDEDTGFFAVDYQASCQRCDFEYGFSVHQDTGAVTKATALERAP